MTAPASTPTAAQLLEDLRSEIAGLANDNTSAGRMFGRIRAEKILRAIGDRLVAPIDAKGSVGESWASYVSAVLIPAGALEVQIEECKRAFYAGAAAMFGDMLDAAELEEEAAAARLETLDRELADYLRLFKKREGV